MTFMFKLVNIPFSKPIYRVSFTIRQDLGTFTKSTGTVTYDEAAYRLHENMMKFVSDSFIHLFES